MSNRMSPFYETAGLQISPPKTHFATDFGDKAQLSAKVCQTRANQTRLDVALSRTSTPFGRGV